MEEKKVNRVNLSHQYYNYTPNSEVLTSITVEGGNKKSLPLFTKRQTNHNYLNFSRETLLL